MVYRLHSAGIIVNFGKCSNDGFPCTIRRVPSGEDEEPDLPTPTFVFALIVATLLGTLAHFIFGGDARRLALLLMVGWVGFALGHILGVAFRIDILNVGTLRLFAAVLGGCLLLAAAILLTGGGKSKRTTG